MLVTSPRRHLQWTLPISAARADTRLDIPSCSMRRGAARLPDDRQWLELFYGFSPADAGAFEDLRPRPKRKSASPVPYPQMTLAQDRAMPAYIAPAPQALKAGAVTARLTTYTLDAHGMFTAILANGQVWRQLSGDTTMADWKPAKSAQYVVTISPGALWKL